MKKLSFLALLTACILEINAVNAQTLNQLQNITPPLPDFAIIGQAQVSPDNQHVVFTADSNIEGVFELFSMPINGGPVISLTPDIASGERVNSFEFTPDGQHVLVRGELRADDIIELFIVPTSGGDLRLLGPSLIEPPFVELEADIGIIKLAPNGERVVFALQKNGFQSAELFSVSVEGGEPVQINDELVSGGSTSVFDITPDSQRVIYVADQVQNNVFELFSSSILGGDSTRLHEALPTIGSANEPAYRDVDTFKISPDGQQVIYRLSFSGSRRGDLAAAKLDGSANQKVDRLIDDFTNVFASVNRNGFDITPDGTQIIYIADQESDTVSELFSIPIQGGSATKINADMQAGGDVEEFKISSDSQNVVYRSDASLDQEFKLFSVNLARGSQSLIAIDPDADNSVTETNFVLSSDSDSVVFDVFSSSDSTSQLFIAPIKAGRQPLALSPTFNDRNEEGGKLVQSSNGEFVTYIPPDNRGIFAARIGALAKNDGLFCFPIKASNGGIAVICL